MAPRSASTTDPLLVREILRGLERAGGRAFNFGPAYYGNLDDADRERMRVAKKLAAAEKLERDRYFEHLRMYRDGASSCPWCEYAFTSLQHVRAIGTHLLHDSCAREYDAWTAGRVELTTKGRDALGDSWEQEQECEAITQGDTDGVA